MIIQQVHINPEITLYITTCDVEKKTITYRLSTMPKIENVEEFQIDDKKLSLPLYFFAVAYLNKFIYENQLI